jgi:hypothetical protein
VGTFNITQLKYTFSMTDPNPSVAIGAGGTVSVTVTTTAPSYTLVLKDAGGTVLKTYAGLTTATPTLALPNNTIGTTRTLTLLHEQTGVIKYFSQSNPAPYVLAGPITLPVIPDANYLASNADCPAGYVKKHIGTKYNIATNGFIPYKNAAGEYWYYPTGITTHRLGLVTYAGNASNYMFIEEYWKVTGVDLSAISLYSAGWAHTGNSNYTYYIYCELE